MVSGVEISLIVQPLIVTNLQFTCAHLAIDEFPIYHVVVIENRTGMISQSFSNLDDISLISKLDVFRRVLS